jgi:hypothetical protein
MYVLLVLCSAVVNSGSFTVTSCMHIQTVANSEPIDCVFCMISTMSAVRHRGQTMLCYPKFESITPVKYKFRHEYGVRLPDDEGMVLQAVRRN